ncbi:MAG: hypothetical protein EZS28_025563 [Streblomastix strix]|uniref:Uncharacterized protein n=1 Tax=Streblomastix strix TaxID=222440 RepID=A0A5J4V8T5_9EUKA|nr:MAG: hypothetical protein EZS28_025563 [Streblomastix strix]
MESNQEVQISANLIISFADSYEQNKQRIEKEQSESESNSIPIFTQVTSSLQSLIVQIQNNNTSKSVIQIPKLLQSLSALATFRIDTHLKQEIDLQRIEVRHWSRQCLYIIQYYGDEQVQSELVRQGYGIVMSFSYCTAGGVGEEQDLGIQNGLYRISDFLRELHEGRDDDWYPSFQPLPLLVPVSLEQIEDEGANEELDAQLNNKGDDGDIIYWANESKAATLNHFIHIN